MFLKGLTAQSVDTDGQESSTYNLNLQIMVNQILLIRLLVL
jgi:hypothetical protein